MYELRQVTLNKQRFETYGFRYNAGDMLDIGIITSLDGSAGTQNHFGTTFLIEGALGSVSSGLFVMVAAVSLMLF